MHLQRRQDDFYSKLDGSLPDVALSDCKKYITFSYSPQLAIETELQTRRTSFEFYERDVVPVIVHEKGE